MMKVTGWTYWHYEDDLNNDNLIDWFDYCWTNRLSDFERHDAQIAVIQELRGNNYHMTGSTHRNWYYSVPILDNKFVFQVSERSWGDLMFGTYPDEDYSVYEDKAKAENKPHYYYNYLKWSFVCPENEEEIIPHVDEFDPCEDFDWCYKCRRYGDDYSVGADRELHGDCDGCPHNERNWED